MDNKKRRVVYLSDQEWLELKQAAAREGVTISAFLREKIADEAQTTAIVRSVTPQAGLADRFNSVPFTGPIPKVRK